MSELTHLEPDIGVARRALDEIEQRGLSASPQNYCVWVAHLAGMNAELSAAMDRMLATGAPLRDSALQHLFEAHFGSGPINDQVLAAGGRIHEELAIAMATLQAAGRNTAAYGQTLSTASGELSKANDPVALKAMVDTLTSATDQMRRQSAELERKLADTTKEVDQLRQNLEKVREEALTDGLTGVANRKRFDEFLAKSIDEAGKTGVPLCLLLADIDHFKRFNDTWGHQTGDQIIRFVAGCLTRLAEGRALVARYGGEEFAVVMPDLSIRHAAEVAERMRVSVENKKLLRKSTNENLGNVTISMGIATWRAEEEQWELVERTDQALYASKQGGRNRVTIAPDPAKKAA